MICKNCGNQMKDDVKFCPFCGGSAESQESANEAVTEPAAEPTTVQPEINAPVKPVKEKKAKKPFNKKKLIAIVAVILVLAIGIGVGIPVISNLTRDDSFILYIKNDQLYIAYTDTQETKKLTKESAEAGGAVYPTYFADSNTLYFADGDDGIKICKLELNSKKPDTKPETVFDLEDVESIRVADDFSRVYYRNGDAELRCAYGDEDERIAVDVDVAYIDLELGRYLYTKDGGIYKFDTSSFDTEKITDYNESSVYENDKGIYTVKDNVVYHIDNAGNLSEVLRGEEGEEIRLIEKYESISGGENIYAIIESDIYNPVSFSEFVNDDLAESDAQVPEFDYYDPKYHVDPEDTWSDYNDLYYEELAIYEAKEDRDYIRSYLADLTYSSDFRSVYYLDGKNAKLLSDKAEECKNYDYGNFALDVKEIDFSAVEKMTITELYEEIVARGGYFYNIEDIIKEHIEAEISYIRFIGAGRNEITEDDYNNSDVVTIEKETSTLYYCVSEYDAETKKLYKASLSADGVIGNAELVADDYHSIEELHSGKVYYLVGAGNEKTLYVDGKRIDDVYASDYSNDINYYHEQGKIIYSKNYSEGTADYYIYDGSSSKLIEKEINTAIIDRNGTIFYSNEDGDLIMVGEKEEIKLDKDADFILEAEIK